MTTGQNKQAHKLFDSSSDVFYLEMCTFTLDNPFSCFYYFVIIIVCVYV